MHYLLTNGRRTERVSRTDVAYALRRHDCDALTIAVALDCIDYGERVRAGALTIQRAPDATPRASAQTR